MIRCSSIKFFYSFSDWNSIRESKRLWFLS